MVCTIISTSSNDIKAICSPRRDLRNSRDDATERLPCREGACAVVRGMLKIRIKASAEDVDPAWAPGDSCDGDGLEGHHLRRHKIC